MWREYKSATFVLPPMDYIVIFLPFLFLLLHHLLFAAGIKTICLWLIITGHECPGCGITHAVVSVLKGHFVEAWHYNHGIVIVFPLLLYEWIKYTYTRIMILFRFLRKN